jgi:hypothetical protein
MSANGESGDDIKKKYLERAVKDYALTEKSLLSLLDVPIRWWPYYQSELDVALLQRGEPFAPTRYTRAYEDYHVYAPNIFAQYRKEQDAIPPELKRNEVVRCRFDVTGESQIETRDGNGNVLVTT